MGQSDFFLFWLVCAPPLRAADLTFAPAASWWQWSDWSSPPDDWSYHSSSSSPHRTTKKWDLLAVISSSEYWLQNVVLIVYLLDDMSVFVSVPAFSGTFLHWWLWLHPVAVSVRSVCPVSQKQRTSVVIWPRPVHTVKWLLLVYCSSYCT